MLMLSAREKKVQTNSFIAEESLFVQQTKPDVATSNFNHFVMKCAIHAAIPRRHRLHYEQVMRNSAKNANKGLIKRAKGKSFFTMRVVSAGFSFRSFDPL